MAIRKLKDVAAADLVGKFFCMPEAFVDRAMGWPAVIEKVTLQRISFRRLYRGTWDNMAKEWSVLPLTPTSENEVASRTGMGRTWDGYVEQREQCQRREVTLVCDTAEEAIALYVQALAAEKIVALFRKSTREGLVERALAGLLPVPFYIASQQA